MEAVGSTETVHVVVIPNITSNVKFQFDKLFVQFQRKEKKSELIAEINNFLDSTYQYSVIHISVWWDSLFYSCSLLQRNFPTRLKFQSGQNTLHLDMPGSKELCWLLHKPRDFFSLLSWYRKSSKHISPVADKSVAHRVSDPAGGRPSRPPGSRPPTDLGTNRGHSLQTGVGPLSLNSVFNEPAGFRSYELCARDT
jgi:hypothetical protein